MNQNPEQRARDAIDRQLELCGWIIQDKSRLNLHAAPGVAVREYTTEIGPADYVLFVGGKPVGILEAKRAEEGLHLHDHEEQSRDYARSKLKYLDNDPLPFVYESTGIITHFTDYRDPKPRAREVFSFHRPETLGEWIKQDKTLRKRVFDIPTLNHAGLRECQIRAIENLEDSFRHNRPRALVQMATGSGKTFTAITFVYRLLTYAKAKRVLFLVDTRNLGEQAESEFLSYTPNDDNRKFPELYGVHRLKSGYVPTDNQVYIGTIQRLYSILKSEELDDAAEDANPNEVNWEQRASIPVAYNAKLPVEFFDYVVIDECHRSIYNLWKQVLEYFDATLVGLTATPEKRTFGFFNQNIVSEYTHEDAVADGVNVGNDVYLIETEVTKKGGALWKGQFVDHREKLSRRKRWEQLDEDVAYTNKQLDEKVVNPDQIRTIIRAFRDHLPEMFPDRYLIENDETPPVFEVPKTLIFAKSDSHADDIIRIVREEFGEENDFCKKITYSSEDPRGTLAQFRNSYNPRIAVTVDMIATGTDVKALECLLFMRDVKSRNYFEQMKGRGTRTIGLDDLRKVSRAAKQTKDHFVIVDAIGVTKSLKTESRPLEQKPGVPLKDLLAAVAVGARDEKLFTSLANRLARLDKQITEKERAMFEEKTGGTSVRNIVKGLLNSYNPDTIDDIRNKVENEVPEASPAEKESIFNERVTRLRDDAARVFTGDLNTFIDNVRKSHEQIIDNINADHVTHIGWDKDQNERAKIVVTAFTEWIETHKDEVTALQIFYAQAYRRRELTYKMIKDLAERIKLENPTLAPLSVWSAYERLETASGQPKNELVALVSLIRRVCGIDKTLTPFDTTVDRNFQNWVFRRHAGTPHKFTDEQMTWLRMIKDHIASSIHIDIDDLDYTPFSEHGGRGRMWELFGEGMQDIVDEMNGEMTG